MHSIYSNFIFRKLVRIKMEEQLDNPEIMDDESVDCDIKKEEELTLYSYYTLRYHDFILY